MGKKGGKIENVGNLDETALFFKLQSSQTLADSKIEGKKILKDRITVAVICSSSGRKWKPIVIEETNCKNGF